ncbi:MAG: tetratricopeptide repeat protein [Candidatus Marinimicrobia bacterium]|jgi:class 3 adenylate cyclase/tetratricopeptide (TPR) repeat protein/TolB-like protein|nr:tetratricopeptide repeat protein [Candidatus Neomarinimicrobiota bacterium]
MDQDKRKLVAIVFTDIVGFTKLTAEDQKKASDLLDIQRAELKPLVESYQGHWVKEMGDGLILTFDTINKAVHCCVKIQQKALGIDHLSLRIGIHLGEILEKENDIIGDDVNVTARIEPFSAPGGIAVSNKVNDALVREPEFKTKFIGKPKLKGVGQIVEVYCIISHDLPETKLSEVSAKLEKSIPIWQYAIGVLLAIGIAGYFMMPKKPKVVSVAVMYMDIIGNKQDQYLETITEDIIFSLSKALPANLLVSEVSSVRKLKNTDMEIADIAKSLGVQFVFRSSLERTSDGFNLGCNLVEAKTGTEKFVNNWVIEENSLQSIVGVLVENIIGGLDIPMAAELRKIEYDPQSYELYLKGIDLYARSDNREQDLEAINMMKESVDLDDKLISAQLRLGMMYYEIGDYTQADFLYSRSLKRSRQLEDNTNIAESLRKQGALLRRQRQYEDALIKFDEALSIFKVMNDKSSMAKAMNSIAILYYKTQRLDEALEYWLQAFSIAKEFDDKLKISKYVNNIGIWYWKDFDYSKAIDYYEQSLAIKEELGDTRNYGKTLNNLGEVYYDMGDFTSAIDHFNQSIAIKDTLGDQLGLNSTLFNLGEAQIYNSNYDDALPNFRRALSIANTLEDKHQISERNKGIGIVHYNLAAYDSASHYLSKSDSIYIYLGIPINRLTTLSWLAITAMKAGSKSQAQNYFQSFNELIDQHDPNSKDIISINWNMYQAHVLAGDKKFAKEYLENSYLELKTRSKKIKNKSDRKKYLSVQLHQNIATAWDNL